MKKFLLDTSVIIDFLRRKDKAETLFYQLADEDLYISMISHTELFAGKSVWEKKEIREVILNLFEGITILPLSEDISEKAGYIHAFEQSKSLIDSIIASTAIINECKLATLNRKDFEQISELDLYKLN